MTNQISDSPPHSLKNGKTERFLAFSLKTEQYAVPLLKVKEVIAVSIVTPVPHAPSHFKGIMNLRGLVISVIDLRMKFAMETADSASDAAIIILDLSPLSLGVIVDSIDTVLDVDTADIQDAPDVEDKVGEYITGVIRTEKRLVLLLDIEKALSIEELKAIKHSSQQKAA